MAKYKNEKKTIDGYRFDSKVEAKFYEKLVSDKAKGLILNFELQPEFTLVPKFTNSFGKKVQSIVLKADFIVYELDHTQTVIDIKGMATSEAKLKRKMFWNIYKGEELLWLVWRAGQWLNYDDVMKAKNKRKRDKKL